MCYRVAVLCFSLVKMVFGFSSRSSSMPTWRELQHAILRNFGGLDDVKPVEVFAKHLRQIDTDAAVCSVIIYLIIQSICILCSVLTIWHVVICLDASLTGLL